MTVKNRIFGIDSLMAIVAYEKELLYLNCL